MRKRFKTRRGAARRNADDTETPFETWLAGAVRRDAADARRSLRGSGAGGGYRL